MKMKKKVMTRRKTMFNILKNMIGRKNKRILLHEQRPMIRGTRVIIRDPESGKVLDEGQNTILYAGSINAMMKDFGYYNYKDADENPIFLQAEDIAIPMSYDVATYGKTDAEYTAEGPVCLFAVGVDGVENAAQSSQKKKVQYEGWIDPSYMVPFRMVAKSDANAITDGQKRLYAQPTSDGRYDYYYFKKFSQKPIGTTTYEVNGSNIISPQNSSIMVSKEGASEYYNQYLIENQYNSGANVIAEMNCKITKEECREWFNYAATDIANQRPNISSIMICTAIPDQYDDLGNILTYKNIMPKSKRTITRELLLDAEKGLDITYQYLY